MIRFSFLGKRGFAMQFNWIFVLIGGGIILVFFFSLINNLLHGEVVSTKIKATQEVDALLKINMASENTQKVTEFGSKIELVFFADRSSTYSEYSAQGSPRTARYDFNAIFSPDYLEGDELIIQTFILDTPFRSMPIVFVTNREVEYVFINTSSSNIIKTVLAFLPGNITYRQVNDRISLNHLEDYPDRNYDRTVFVTDSSNFDYIDGVRFDSFSRPAERLFAVVISPGPGTIASYGNIRFYHYDSEDGFALTGSSPYFDHRLAVGGIISHDRNIFENNLRKILKRINLLSGLYARKIAGYAADGNLFECQHLYQTALLLLEDIEDYSVDEEELSYESMSNLFLANNDLKTSNSLIVAGKDCPGIY